MNNKDEIKIIGIDIAKNNNMDEKFKTFYKKYPDKFLEEFLDLKLSLYQKIVLRHFGWWKDNK